MSKQIIQGSLFNQCYNKFKMKPEVKVKIASWLLDPDHPQRLEKMPKEFVYISSTDKTALDELDLDIAIVLSENARSSNLELGKKLSVSADTARNRIQKVLSAALLHQQRRISQAAPTLLGQLQVVSTN